MRGTSTGASTIPTPDGRAAACGRATRCTRRGIRKAAKDRGRRWSSCRCGRIRWRSRSIAMRVMYVALCAGLSFAPAIVRGQSSPKGHEREPSQATVHRGFFDASLKPVLTIDSGDVVRLETATGNPRYFEKLGVPKEKIPAELYAVYEGVDNDGRGDHTLNGPIAVRGAEPGDTLEIRIRSVDVRLPIAGQGFVPNRGQLPEDFPYEKQRVVWIDVPPKMVLFAPGIEIPARPFWGVMGVAPPASMGRVPSGPPGIFGGNLDNPDLVTGSTLYLPVHVPGALLSIGDGHAVQGHGEVSLSAVEISLKGEVQVA